MGGKSSDILLALGRWLILFAGTAALLASCTGLKHVPADDQLFEGFDIAVVGTGKAIRELRTEIKQDIRPKPAGKLLWMRPSIALYNAGRNARKEKGFRRYLQKTGSKPFLISELDTALLGKALKNELFHGGYFDADLTIETRKRRKTAKVELTISLGTPYRVSEYTLPKDTSDFLQDLSKVSRNGSVSIGMVYDLDELKSERNRIGRAMKDRGYFFFEPEYLLFRADSTATIQSVQLALEMKSDIAPKAQQRYRLDRVYLHDDYRFSSYLPDTSQYGLTTYLSQDHAYNPAAVLRATHLKPGDHYSLRQTRTTTNHLTNLGIYRLVNVSYRESEQPNTLHAFIYATPSKPISTSLEFGSMSRSTNYVGPNLQLSYQHRNLFKGAERWFVDLTGRFEVQVGADSVNTSLDFGLETGIEIPRVFPFKNLLLTKPFVPNTYGKVGYRFFNRIDLYTLNSLFTSLGYSWRATGSMLHRLDLVDVSLTRVTNKTPEFEDFLDDNPNVQRSFEDQLIIGSRYGFTFNPVRDQDRNHFFYDGRIELAGNLLQLAAGGNEADSTGSSTLNGLPYSQFARWSNDLRYTWSLNGRNQLVSRFFFGLGIPYGNSSIMPFVRQYFAGGTNSIRAFTARTVGPGSYRAPATNLGVDQSGDLKLEGNLEYRLALTPITRTALFVDVGNIWLINEDETREGAQFAFGDFHQELAVGAGFGLRFDIEFFVLRIDWGFPLRIPSLPVNERWVINEIDFFDKSWRKDNILWNFAIGYPF